jgi:hypothetical protein
MNKNTLTGLLFSAAALLVSCEKYHPGHSEIPSEKSPVYRTISAAPVLDAPIAEAKVYKLLPGYKSSDVFEASGIQYLNGYFYVVCDNMQKIAKIKSTLPLNSSQNALVSTSSPGSGSSDYEGITYDSNGTPNFFVVEEAVSNGGNYQPRISELNASLSYQNRMWASYNFSSSNSNKGFEGIAWAFRNGENYMLGLAEGTGAIPVLHKTASGWEFVTVITLPSSVTFTDYSDIAVYGDQIAITSQEDGQLWLGTLSSTSWTITGGSAFTFPLGNSSGVIGSGSNPLYGNVEGVTFISSTQIAICSDKRGGSQPSYQSYKEQTVSIFNIP